MKEVAKEVAKEVINRLQLIAKSCVKYGNFMKSRVHIEKICENIVSFHVKAEETIQSS